MEDNNTEVGRRVRAVMAMVDQLENNLWESEREEFIKEIIVELKKKPAISNIKIDVLKILPSGKLGSIEETTDANGHKVMAIRWVFEDEMGYARETYFDLNSGMYIGEA